MTVLMMSLVYAQLLFVPALIEGAIDQAEEQLITTAAASVQIAPAGGAATIGDAQAFAEEIAGFEGVDAVTSVTRTGSEMTAGSVSGSWPVDAVDPESYAQVFATPANIIEGRWLEPGDTDGIVLGIGIAGAGREEIATYRQSLRSVHAGDTVTVSLLDGTMTELIVVGVYQNQFAASDSRAFIARSALEALYPPASGTASAIFVTTDPGAEQDVVGNLRSVRADVTYETWQDQRHSIDEQVESFNLIKQILRVVSLLVAAVTVVIVTYVDLVSKRRTIGIERAIGIRSNAIVIGYALKAVFYALIGAALGGLLFVGAIVPIIDSYPFPFPIGPVTLAVSGQQLRDDAVVLVVVAVIAALVPAWRSVRIQILEAIWT